MLIFLADEDQTADVPPCCMPVWPFTHRGASSACRRAHGSEVNTASFRPVARRPGERSQTCVLPSFPRCCELSPREPVCIVQENLFVQDVSREIRADQINVAGRRCRRRCRRLRAKRWRGGDIAPPSACPATTSQASAHPSWDWLGPAGRPVPSRPTGGESQHDKDRAKAGHRLCISLALSPLFFFNG